MIRSEDVCFASLLGERKEKKGARTLCFTLLLGERKEEKKKPSCGYETSAERLFFILKSQHLNISTSPFMLLILLCILLFHFLNVRQLHLHLLMQILPL